jgi:hypothetical protein
VCDEKGRTALHPQNWPQKALAWEEERPPHRARLAEGKAEVKPVRVEPSKQLRADTISKSPKTSKKDSITTLLKSGSGDMAKRRSAAKKKGLWA